MNIFGNIADEVVNFLEDVGRDVESSIDKRLDERLQKKTGDVLVELSKQESVQKGIAGFAFDTLIVPAIAILFLFLFLKK